jgi:hypothetical protein
MPMATFELNYKIDLLFLCEFPLNVKIKIYGREPAKAKMRKDNKKIPSNQILSEEI